MTKKVIVGAVSYDHNVVPFWELMRKYFQKENYALDYVLFSNYEAQVEALLNGFIDIAWNSSVAYVKAQERADGKAKILAMRDTDLDFTSKLVVKEDALLHTIKDIKKKKVALGHYDSAQASILPSYYIAKSGFNLRLDLTVMHIERENGTEGDSETNELAVLEAIETGKADAGVIGCSTWRRLLESGILRQKRLKSIWTSPSYSHYNFTCLPIFNQQLAERFTQILLAMDASQEDVKQMMELAGCNEWVLSGNEGYYDLANAMRILRMIEKDPLLV